MDYNKAIESVCFKFGHAVTEYDVFRWLRNFDESEWTMPTTATSNNINYFLSSGLKELPILDNKDIPDRFLFDNGYYLFEKEDSNDERDFKLFIVDTENNKAILYYQCM